MQQENVMSNFVKSCCCLLGLIFLKACAAAIKQEQVWCILSFYVMIIYIHRNLIICKLQSVLAFGLKLKSKNCN